MPNVSIVPGSPQSSTSTVKGSVVVPVDRITAAIPVTLACLPVIGAQKVPGLLINSPPTDWAFIRTSIAWSSYSRFPVGFPIESQHLTAKPKVACALGSAKLGIRAGTDRRSPKGEKMGSSPGIWPPPVTFPGVEGTPPTHTPLGAGEMSQGVKSAFPTTSSPIPPGLLVLVGPVNEPHQLHSALTVPTWLPGSTSSPSPPKLAKPTVPMLFSLITTRELGPPTSIKKLRRMAWPATLTRSLLSMLRSLLLSKSRMVALRALVLLVMLLS